MLKNIDLKIINFFRKIGVPLARLSFFVVFFWFGFLKVLGLSPATPLVLNLFNKTINFIDFDTFFLLFGLFECLIGLLFLIPKMERVVIPLLFIHLITTAGPLFLIPEIWSRAFVPTLEGQYIIKNLFIIVGGILIVSNLKPINQK